MIYSSVRDAAGLLLGPRKQQRCWDTDTTVPTAALTATISDNSSVILLARYTNGLLKLYGGYEWIRYAAPSDIHRRPLPILQEILFALAVPRSTTPTSAIEPMV